ncbi:MAG: UDP-3-O-[3-hydroxymyristoyl] N-acetylglucosamine deacetylase, partial [uncultured Ramlibacter sp.]
QRPGPGRRHGQRHRDGRLPRAQRRRPALRRRVRQAQDPRRDGRPVPAGQAAARGLRCLPFRPCVEQQAAACAARPARRVGGRHLPGRAEGSRRLRAAGTRLV